MSNNKESLSGYIFTFIIALVLGLLIRRFVFSANIINGVSMEPTFTENDRVIALIFPLYYKDPEYADVVIINSPIEEGKEYIKRIVGKPGDKIEVMDGNVIRNGEILEENYIDKDVETGIYFEDSWQLGDDEFFVLGDNRHPNKSSDSRAFGPIKKDSIDGIVKLRFWPFSKFGTVGGINE